MMEREVAKNANIGSDFVQSIFFKESFETKGSTPSNTAQTLLPGSPAQKAACAKAMEVITVSFLGDFRGSRPSTLQCTPQRTSGTASPGPPPQSDCPLTNKWQEAGVGEGGRCASCERAKRL